MNRSKKTLFIIIIIFFGLSCSDKEVITNEEEKNYIVELSVSPSNAGTVTGAGTFKKGETITITASPKTDFIFNYWQVAESNEVFSKERSYSFQVNQSLSLIAVFKNVEEEDDEDDEEIQDLLDIDGNVYTTVKIGSQTWMVENLKVTRYRNGDPVGRVNDDKEWGDVTGKYGVYQNNNEVVSTAGYLYNWYVLTDPRDIAPEGWRVPTDEDWTILVNYLGGEAVAGGKLKSTDPAHWNSPNTGATNSSGFTAVGGGVAHVNVTGANLGTQGIYWSSSGVNATTGLIRIMESSHTQAIYSGANKKNGYSVRLIKAEKEENINYTVELSVSSPNTGTVTGVGTYKRGERVTISASPETGYAFHSWQIAGSDEIFSREALHSFYIGEDLTLIAVFKNAEENHLIDISEQAEIETIPNYGVYIPKDKLFMVTRYIGDDFIRNGISMDHSGIVNDNGNISMVLNTKELELRGMYTPITGGGPHMWVFKHFSTGVFPWSKSENYLSLSVKAAMPHVQLTDAKGNVATHNFTSEQAPVTQLSFGLYFRDRTNNITFAITVPMYESRGTFQETANQHDTSTPFAISPLDVKSRYVTKTPKSNSLQYLPFENQKYFEVQITKQNLDRIIRDTKANLSSDITRYELTMAGIMFELPNYVENGHNVSMANISELEVKIVGMQN